MDRGRRAAHALGRVRLERGERAAAASAHRAPLRGEPALPRELRDTCRSGRARRAAVRAPGRGRHGGRFARGSAHLRHLRSADRECRRGPSRERARGGARARRGRLLARPPDDLLLPAAHVGRGPHALPEGVGAAHGTLARRGARLPRRLSAAPAPRDRGGPEEGRGQGRRVDQCARARHRHRCARRGRPGGLPRLASLVLATCRPRRPPRQAEPGAADRALRSARSVPRAAPRVAVPRAARAHRPRSREPRDPLRAAQVRGLRAAVPRSRPAAASRTSPSTGPRDPRPRSSITWPRSRTSCTSAAAAGGGWPTPIRPRA